MGATSGQQTRSFLAVATAASLVAWEIGFDAGAFDTFSYRRVFAVFVVSTVVLVATFVVDDDDLPTSWLARGALAIPLVFLIADLAFLTEWLLVVDVLAITTVAVFPYAVYLLAKVLAGDYFALDRRLQVVTAIVALCVAGAGWYVGQANERFLVCSDFERIGDYQPPDCTR